MAPNRLPEFLAYFRESIRIKDIDPSYGMLLYVCDRFELTNEQRYWLAFVYALTYCGASTFFVYNEFPDFQGLDSGRMTRWWDSYGREQIICQTDRRWCRSRNQLVPSIESYRKWVGNRTQEEHFASIAVGTTPEERYNRLYESAKCLFTFGRFTLFLYLEALHTITPLDLAPTELDLDDAWSPRFGLYYVYGMDEHITDTESPIPYALKEKTQLVWQDLQTHLAAFEKPPSIWSSETQLCAFRKFFRGKRYVGYYLDRLALENAKMQDHVKHGVSWSVLADYRRENLLPDQLVENTAPWSTLALKGLPQSWKSLRDARTTMLLHEASKTEEPR